MPRTRPFIREALKSLLKRELAVEWVGEAADGFEAVRCVRDHSPDLVLMDLTMPGVDDLEAIREIKEAWPQVKAILTHREREVLKLIAEGHRNRDIGELLHTSERTVEKHRTTLTRKPGLRGTQALINYAIGKGLIPP